MPTTYLLAIDAGSSSIRCTAYQLQDEIDQNNNSTNTTSSNTSILQSTPYHHSIPLSIVTSSTSSIRINPILTAIDECIDVVLSLLRDSLMEGEYTIASVGLSTFVMNFIGVDLHGDVVEEATCWYGCNSREVGIECEKLKW